jgi:hypothetical protein
MGPPQRPSDLLGHAQLMPCDIDLEAISSGVFVLAIAGIGKDGVECSPRSAAPSPASRLRARGRHTGHPQRSDVGDELAPSGV